MGNARKYFPLLATAGLLASGAAQATLFDRGGGLLYDDVLKVTWLQDANYAKTSGYDADGYMNWADANAWAANLVYHDSVRGVDFDDWRLPTALNQDGSGPCVGDGCASSELGHMFYNSMGAAAGSSILSGANTANLALFKNLQSYAYWSGTAYAPYPAGAAWYFLTFNGLQSLSYQYVEMLAWAVRPGDVAAVPEPETVALFLAGLAVIGRTVRRRRHFGPS